MTQRGVDRPHYRNANDEEGYLDGEKRHEKGRKGGAENEMKHRREGKGDDDTIRRRPKVRIHPSQPPAGPGTDEIDEWHPPEVPGSRERTQEIAQEVADDERWDEVRFPDDQWLKGFRDPHLQLHVRD